MMIDYERDRWHAAAILVTFQLLVLGCQPADDSNDNSTTGSLCLEGTFHNVGCDVIGSSCNGGGDYEGWSCSCMDAKSPTWECSEPSEPQTICAEGIYDQAACQYIDEICVGSGDWIGWSCTCTDRGSALWQCEEADAEDVDYCAEDVLGGIACSDVGTVCAGAGDWIGWKCECEDVGSPLWECSEPLDSLVACGEGTYEKSACDTVGDSCIGTGDWEGWTCECADSNSALWNCFQE